MPTAAELARTARRLKVQTVRLVRTHLAGAYASAFHGPGMAFEELRHYCPGDDVRQIDWHATARMREPFVRRFIEERELRVMLIVDVSRSMDVGAGEHLSDEEVDEDGQVHAA